MRRMLHLSPIFVKRSLRSFFSSLSHLGASFSMASTVLDFFMVTLISLTEFYVPSCQAAQDPYIVKRTANKGVIAMKNRAKIIYWTLTLLLFVPAGLGALVELVTDGPQNIVTIMLALGYPLYLMKILGFAKLLGSIAILYGKFPKLKEWAYAGFALDFLGASASH
ncbi:MAG: DoxX family protein, partial [Proteobacteria bacterium]